MADPGTDERTGLNERLGPVASPTAEDLFAGGGEMGALMRSVDWSRTPLGPVESWPQSLRTSVGILLTSGYPMYIPWGPEYTQLYNDAFRPILGAKHPAALGGSARETWAEIWDFIRPLFEAVMHAGETITRMDQQLFIDRGGYLEEVYFDFSYSPVREEAGGIGGVFVTCSETTGRVLGERRLGTLRELAAGIGDARTVEAACGRAAQVLAGNPADLPFTLIYLLDGDQRRARLTGAAGLPIDTAASPSVLDLASGGRDGATGRSTAWPIEDVVGTGHGVLVEDVAGRFAGLTAGPWPDPLPAALLLPIAGTGQDQAGAVGVLVAGISPRRALDDQYRNFLNLVAGHVASAVANARAYEEERRRAEELAELDRAKTTFFSNISHEFRTPLTLMLGPLEDLLADRDGLPMAERMERIQLAHRNGLRLLKLVNTLLDFSRIEAGRIQAAYEPTDLATFTADLASVFRSATERAGLRLLVDCPPLPEPVYVDREMWEKIVLNLLSNAFKFTFEGEIAVTLRADDGGRTEDGGRTTKDERPIDVSLRPSSSVLRPPSVVLEVRDTGTGIPDHQLPRVFERFHRVEGARGRTYEGTGIGLALVHELVKLHGGTVRAESVLGKGSTFTVAIPFGSAHLPADRLGGARVLASTATGATPYVEEALRWLPGEGSGEESTPGPGGNAARILLADDNADMREYVHRLLGERYEVEAVADGEAALARARERPPDLVLADVMMPRLDGFGLLRELRADPRTGTIPVIFLSARAGEESRIDGLEAGADDYLVKPFSARELLARIGTCLELTSRQSEAAGRERVARADAEASIRSRDEFLATVSHDLKNPLASVKGFAQMLTLQLRRSGELDSERTLQALGRIDAEATKMSTIIDELLEVARLRSERDAEVGGETTDLVALARRVVDKQAQSTPRHVLRVEAGRPRLVGPWNAARLERVLENLLSNAIKYSPTGGEIVVRVSPAVGDGAWAAVEVRDQGIGIPAGDLAYIFEPFHRAGNVSDGIDGTGVGLASARQIVEQQGGSIHVESQEGVGSAFTVRLPLARPN
jgi:signal transduction histidine kinase